MYFPEDSLVAEHFRGSRARSLCFWKGIASYSDIVVDDVVVPQAAWRYPHPSPLARKIKGRSRVLSRRDRRSHVGGCR